MTGNTLKTMGAPGYTDAVSAHYTDGDLGTKILASLRTAGKDPDALQVEDLVPMEPPPLAAQLTLGPQLLEMVRTVGRNLREDRLTFVQAVFERS